MRFANIILASVSLTLPLAMTAQTSSSQTTPSTNTAPVGVPKPKPAAGVPVNSPTPGQSAAQQVHGSLPSAPVTDTKAYPFQQALDALQGRQTTAPAVPSVGAAAAGANGGPAYLHRSHPMLPAGREVASVSVPRSPVAIAPLSISAEQAVAISQAAKQADALPAAGKDGRVTYTFGQGLPTIVCAPLHVCIIELQPGESVSGEPAIGDGIRWELMPGVSGDGSDAEPLVMIKPHEAGLDTNLVIPTNKRTYYLRLVSRTDEYIARTSFSYKDDEDKRWKEYVDKQNAARVDRENAQVVTKVAGNAIDNLYFDYDIKGGDAIIRPIRVMDDGEKTYITMPDAVLHQDLPALVVLNPRLKKEKAEEIVNYRVKGNLYIVDRLFDQAALLIGNGKSAQKVVIKRRVSLAEGPHMDRSAR